MLKYQNVPCKRPGFARSLSFFFVQRRNGNENVAYNKKWICVFSVFIAIIPEDEFQGTISKSRNMEKKISLLLAYVLHKTRKRQRNAQKCVMHVQSCCLLIKPISFFVLFCFFLTFSLLSFCWILKSLWRGWRQVSKLTNHRVYQELALWNDVLKSNAWNRLGCVRIEFRNGIFSNSMSIPSKAMYTFTHY